MTELKPCPFCGAEASVKMLEYDDDCRVWGVFCESDLESEYSHGHYVDNYPTEAEAIAAWNTRHERTCERVVHGLEREREVATVSWTCSECHAHIGRDYRYCPNCGAKVLQ
jgi:Lar family restriction alleviation protein